MGTPALARRYEVRTKYASHLHPSFGWVPGAPPCIWTFLSSLGQNEFFSGLLVSPPMLKAGLHAIALPRRGEVIAPVSPRLGSLAADNPDNPGCHPLKDPFSRDRLHRSRS